MTRHELIFNLRYAARVLEISSSVWQKVNSISRFASFLSGTAFIALMAAQSNEFAIMAAVMFGILLAVDAATNPGEKAAARLAQKKLYAQILSEKDRLSDAELQDRLQRAQMEDEIIVSMQIRQLAYNQVVVEKGLSESEKFPLNTWQKMLEAVC